ncbi:MAG: hypothetical protein FWC22_04350 [Treponema sp.]|nr:hypothetical protein [Treponema sp.]
MAQKMKVLKSMDNKSVGKYDDMSIQHSITTKLDFNINIAGTVFNDMEEAIIHAYRCGLASMSLEQSIKNKEGASSVDQDELYKLLKDGNSFIHKADFLREIAKEWFPMALHSDKKIKTVNLELNELADFLEK